MFYGVYKHSPGGTNSDRALRDRGFKISYNPNDDVYQGRLVSMIYRFLTKSCYSHRNRNSDTVSDRIPANRQIAK